MHIGFGTFRVRPVGVRRPVSLSILKIAIVLLSRFAANRNCPVGSILKFLGFLPCVDVCSIGVRWPSFWLIAKTAMESCPRFEPYRNLPDG